MATLLCSNGSVEISEEDIDFARKLNPWVDSGNYAQVWFEGEIQRLHVLIAQRAKKILRSEQVWDHMDRNTLNNSRWNIRPATKRQNNLNRKTQVNNASGFVGVSWHRQTKTWQAFTKIAGRVKFLGCYTTKESAAKARDYWCSRSFDREFYTYNFPKELDFSDLRIRLKFHLGRGIK